ncbi:hypothetical protein Tco_1122088 [Tanacetum coccineum]|uniref:Uncharacterized protein n=1 Tax=Tanacetum coccineum TaxID=301880 RepID=A0ABQ5J2I4_9ASTR
MISPAFVEANYEILESLLYDRRRQIRNEGLRTELEYFSEDYDNEREMEPRPERTREVTPPLRTRSPRVRRQRERVVGFEEVPNREGSRTKRNTEGNRPSKVGAEENGRRGRQSSINIGGNLPPNDTLLSHHAQPFIPSSAHIPNGFVPTHVNPYSQPSVGITNGRTTSFPFQAQTGNPSIGGTSVYPLQGGYIPQTFPNDGLKMPSHVGSYDGKGDPDNFLHLFEGAIRMQKWLMQSSDHTLANKSGSRRRTWQFTTSNKEKAKVLKLSPLEQETWSNTSPQTFTWIEAREVATNGAPNDRRDNFERSRKSSWDNGWGQKSRDMFSPYPGPNHGLLSSLSKSPREILATEKVARSFEQPPRMLGSRRSRDMSKYCYFHEDHGHDTNDCRQLRSQIEESVKSGQLSHLVKWIKKERAKTSGSQRGEKKEKSTTPAKAPILMINQEEACTRNIISKSPNFE